MDLSEIYIKMCEKAVEIQEYYSIPKAGDFISTASGIEIVLDYAYLTKDGFSEDKNLNHDQDELKIYVDTDMIIGFTKNKFTFLPRQDQLQEIVKKHLTKNIEIGLGYIADFNHWWINGENFYNAITQEQSQSWFPPASMEQLWLAYAMLVIYTKTWNGEEWIK